MKYFDVKLQAKLKNIAKKKNILHLSHDICRMTHLEIPIIKRRQLRPMALLTGLLAMGLLGYYTYIYMMQGSVPVLDELIRLLGLTGYRYWFYVGTLAVLLLLVIPFLQTILKQKLVKNGLLLIKEEHWFLKEADILYQLSAKELEQLEVTVLSEKKLEKRRKLGGSFLKIPTSKGLFRCEFHLEGQAERNLFLSKIKTLKEKQG